MFLCKLGSEEKDERLLDTVVFTVIMKSVTSQENHMNFIDTSETLIVSEVIDENSFESFAVFQAKFDFE